MTRDYEAISNSLLFCIQTLTNEIDKSKSGYSTLSKQFNEAKDLLQNNRDEYFKLKDKYNNALAMIEELTKSKPITESKVVQEELDLSIDKPEKKSYLVDPNHFKMQPSRRKLTTEQAQHAYNCISQGLKTITEMAKSFNVSVGTLGSLMAIKNGRPKCYLEIIR